MKNLVTLLFSAITMGGIAWAQSVADINKALLTNIDQITPFHEGLAAVRRGESWGFIDNSGAMVIEFRNDLFGNSKPEKDNWGITGIAYPRFRDGLCPIRVYRQDESGIPFYGYIDKTGKTAIEAQFLNVSEFKDGLAVGIYFQKTLRGKNNFQLNIYAYTFTEVVLNTEGEMIWPLLERHHIMMDKRRYKSPEVLANILNRELVVIGSETNPNQLELRKIKR